MTRKGTARKINATMAQVKRRKKLSATNTRNLRTLLLLTVFAPEEIGGRIAIARRETGLTQEEAADLVGVSTRSWQGYELGEVVPYRHIDRISTVLNRTIAWLLHGDKGVGPEDRLARIERQVAEIHGWLAPPESPDLASADRLGDRLRERVNPEP